MPDAVPFGVPGAVPARPRVAMVTPRYAPFVGGVETHVQEVSRRLIERGVAVSVLTIDETGRLPLAEVVDGVRVRRYPANAPGGFSTALRRDVISRAPSFDLVHVQGVHTALPALALDAARRSQLRSVLTFHTGGHSSRLRNAARDVQWQALRPLLRRVDRLVAVCEYEVDYFSRRTGLPLQRFALIRNGASPLPVDPDAARGFAGSPLIVCVARLERYKGQHRLIAAMPAVLARAPGARLVLVGSGPYADALREQAQRLGVLAQVEFAAFTPTERGQLGALLRQADVGALLSDYEAHPVAVLEGAALGLPTLVATGSGLTELISAGLAHGIAKDAAPAAIADSLLALARPGRAERSAVRLPTWDDTVDAIVELYRDVLAGSGFEGSGSASGGAA